MKIEDGAIRVDGAEIALPSFASATLVRVWRVPADYRECGLFVAPVLPDQPVEMPACAQNLAEYLGEVMCPADPALRLAAAKAARLELLGERCNAELAALAAAYPESELKTWPQQLREAEALSVDPEAAAPLLRAIAAERGADVADLARRVIEKSAAHAEQSGTILGRLQVARERLKAASTMTEVVGVGWAEHV